MNIRRLISLDKVEYFGDLAEFSDDFLVLVEVDPVSLVYVPAALAMNHVTIGRIICALPLLPVENVLSQVDLIQVTGIIVSDLKGGSWHVNRLGLVVAIPHGLARVMMP